MTPEMEFRCLLVCNDAAVYNTMTRVLRDFSIAVEHCLLNSRGLKALEKESLDLVVIDCNGDTYPEFLQKLSNVAIKPKPTTVLITEHEHFSGGSHIFLTKPVTDWCATEALKSAYSGMLLNHRLHARHAVYEPVEARDDTGNSHRVVVTDLGEGGFGLRATNLSVGTRVSLLVHPPGLPRALNIKGRVIWTREYGTAGCQIVAMPPVDRDIFREWLKDRTRVRKPLIEV